MRTSGATRRQRGTRTAAVAVAAAGTALLALAVAGCGTRSGPGASMPAPTTSRPYDLHLDTLPPGSDGFERYGVTPGTRPGVTPGTTPGATATPTTVGCAESGPRLGAGPADAAMGLRQSTVTLTNCGPKSLTVNGYPKLRLLDDRGRTIAVRVHHGDDMRDDVTDPGPVTMTLRPGQQAIAVLAWRNLVTDATVDAVTGAAVRVALGAGEQTVPLHVDLGNTGTLDVTAWQRPK